MMLLLESDVCACVCVRSLWGHSFGKMLRCADPLSLWGHFSGPHKERWYFKIALTAQNCTGPLCVFVSGVCCVWLSVCGGVLS